MALLSAPPRGDMIGSSSSIGTLGVVPFVSVESGKVAITSTVGIVVSILSVPQAVIPAETKSTVTMKQNFLSNPRT